VRRRDAAKLHSGDEVELKKGIPGCPEGGVARVLSVKAEGGSLEVEGPTGYLYVLHTEVK
jgi:hypothetical protein